MHTGVASRCSAVLLLVFARLTIAAQHHGAGGDQYESNLSGKSFVHWSFALIMVACQIDKLLGRYRLVRWLIILQL